MVNKSETLSYATITGQCKNSTIVTMESGQLSLFPQIQCYLSMQVYFLAHTFSFTFGYSSLDVLY